MSSAAGIKQVLVEPLPVPSQVGDAAIAVGAITLLRQAFPAAKIVGVAERLEPSDPASVEGFLRTYEVDELIRAPLSLDGPAGEGEASRLRRHWDEIRLAAGKYATPAIARLLGKKTPKLLPKHLGKLVEKVATSDLVVMRGGGYLSSPHLWCDLLALRLNAINTITIARAAKVPYAIWGHSVWGLDGPLSRRLLWPLIRDSALTACREEISYRYLLDAGAPADHLKVLPDTALAVEPVPAERVSRIWEQEGLSAIDCPLIGVNVRPLWGVMADYETLKPRHLHAMAEMMRHMHDRYHVHSIIVSQCHSYGPFHVGAFQDDRELGKELLARIGANGYVHTLRGEYRPQELCGLYGSLEMMVSTRLHAGIMAATAGTPSVCLAYEAHKNRGIARMLGLSDFVMDISAIDTDALITTAERLWHHRHEVRPHLQAALPQLRARMDEYSRLTMHGMARMNQGCGDLDT